jgi:hypothetical protein
MKENNYISAYYLDDDELIAGIKQLKEKSISINNVLTPFPVHGLDHLLGFRRSWIARVGFIGGAIGAICGFWFQTWIFTIDYPINYGGKPFFAVPSFIPVTFECAILFAAFSMIMAFFIRGNLGAGAKNKIYHEDITDDKFVVVVDTDDKSEQDIETLKADISNTGASIIEVKTSASNGE